MGKYYDYTNKEKIDQYDDIHSDILWYLLIELTKVNRIVSKESLRDFLIRYLLITNKPLDISASDYFENGVLISGVLDSDPFIFKVKDLLNFIGFSGSTSEFNISGTITEFIERYEYKKPLINIEESKDEKNTHNVSLDVLIYTFSGLNNLIKLDSLSVTFKPDLKDISQVEIDSITRFVDFVITEVDDTIFTEYRNKHSKLFEITEERFFYSKIIKFNPWDEISTKNLNKIYHYIENENFNENDVDDYFDGDEFEFLDYDIITFAYGVKHDFIKLSYDIESFRWAYIAYFDFDDMSLLGPDEEVYSTGDIYDVHNIEKWKHLLP